MAHDPVVFFVARAHPLDASDVDAANVWLRTSLGPVIRQYEAEYGLGSRPPRVYTFVHHCTRPLLRRGAPFQYFTGLIDECQQEGLDLALVLRGWDAITADDVSFRLIFERCASLSIRVNVRVFDGDPRLDHPFFELNLAQIFSVMNGDLGLEYAAVDENTFLYMVKTQEAFRAEVIRVTDSAVLQVSL